MTRIGSRAHHRGRTMIRCAAAVGGGVAAVAMVGLSVRSEHVAAEAGSVLPGDDLLASVDLMATRGITIRTSPQQVWPWIAQIGQGRGGFYSYDFLENLVGCKIHSADRVHPQWQHIGVGTVIHLAPEVSLSVAAMEPGAALVLRGAVPLGAAPAPYDFTWSFVLRPGRNDTTRLLVRERYRYTQRWAPLVVRPAGLISSLMSAGMLRGIKKRAELNQGRSPIPDQRASLQPGSWADLESQADLQSDLDFRPVG